MYIIVYLFLITIFLIMIYSSHQNVKRVQSMGDKGEFHKYVVSGGYHRERQRKKSKLSKKKKR